MTCCNTWSLLTYGISLAHNINNGINLAHYKNNDITRGAFVSLPNQEKTKYTLQEQQISLVQGSPYMGASTLCRCWLMEWVSAEQSYISSNEIVLPIDIEAWADDLHSWK